MPSQRVSVTRSATRAVMELHYHVDLLQRARCLMPWTLLLPSQSTPSVTQGHPVPDERHLGFVRTTILPQAGQPLEQQLQHAHKRLIDRPLLGSPRSAICWHGCGSARGVVALHPGSTSAQCRCGPRAVARCYKAWLVLCRSLP